MPRLIFLKTECIKCGNCFATKPQRVGRRCPVCMKGTLEKSNNVKPLGRGWYYALHNYDFMRQEVSQLASP